MLADWMNPFIAENELSGDITGVTLARYDVPTVLSISYPPVDFTFRRWIEVVEIYDVVLTAEIGIEDRCHV